MTTHTADMKNTLKGRRPSQQRGTDTVEALREAAARLLETREGARVSVADLARTAGIGVGTFYHFYPSKEALLLDLREQLFFRGDGKIDLQDQRGVDGIAGVVQVQLTHAAFFFPD